MNTRSSIWSYGLATLLIEDILYNHTSTPLEFRRNRMRERFGVEFQAESYLAADGLLSYAVFRRADLTVVTLDGIETVAHGLRLNRGYAIPPERGHPYPANQFFVDNAINIWGACSLSGCNMQGPLIVGGHSGGGGDGRSPCGVLETYGQSAVCSVLHLRCPACRWACTQHSYEWC